MEAAQLPHGCLTAARLIPSFGMSCLVATPLSAGLRPPLPTPPHSSLPHVGAVPPFHHQSLARAHLRRARTCHHLPLCRVAPHEPPLASLVPDGQEQGAHAREHFNPSPSTSPAAPPATAPPSGSAPHRTRPRASPAPPLHRSCTAPAPLLHRSCTAPAPLAQLGEHVRGAASAVGDVLEAIQVCSAM